MRAFISVALLSLCSALPVPAPQSSKDIAAALKIHNDARAAVGHAPLVWDAGLASNAAGWAGHLASQRSLDHSGVSGQGENLYMGWNGAAFAAASGWWVTKEKGSYHGQPIPGAMDKNFPGHYTQIIWPTTTHVGMGWATANDGSTWVVARYSPPGNTIGKTAL